jgi:hypothetical protein
VDEQRRQRHEAEQLQELRLPALQGALPELPQERADLERLVVSCCSFAHVNHWVMNWPTQLVMNSNPSTTLRL